MFRTEKHDEMLCREILGVDVFNGTRKGTVKRSAKWSQVVENLSDIEEMEFKVDNRAVRDRYNLLATNLRRKLKKEEKASGIAVEMSQVETALELLIEKEDAAEELRNEGKTKKITNENERVNAEDMRKKAMESLGETRKRKSDEIGTMGGKKTRSNGSDAIKYLKEKQEKMIEVEKQRISIEERKLDEANKRHKELMLMMQRQQQQLIGQASIFCLCLLLNHKQFVKHKSSFPVQPSPKDI